MREFVIFYLNGQKTIATGDEVFMSLADYLRYAKQLTGTKIVCAEGDCGACTVLRYFESPAKNSTSHFQPINSCIALVGQMDGSHLVTIEGLKEDEKLHPVQDAVAKCHGSQCGFCTPGFVMSLTGMYERHKDVDEKTIKNHVTGNLCRCTGYQPIIDAALSVDGAHLGKLSERFLNPVSLKELRAQKSKQAMIQVGRKHWYSPTNLKELRLLLKKYPKARILNSATDLGVIKNKNRLTDSIFISLHLVKELYEFKTSKARVRVGARISLAELRRRLPHESEVTNFLDLFASPQIKNLATLVGNIANASPIADTPPFLLALDAELEILSPKSQKLKRVKLDDFYLAYKKTALKPGECIVAVEFNLPKADETLKLVKASQRKDLDISCVNASFWLKPDAKRPKSIADIRIAFGGVAAIPLRLKKTENILRGKEISPDSIEAAVNAMHSEISPISDLRGSSAYRRILSENYFREFLNGASL